MSATITIRPQLMGFLDELVKLGTFRNREEAVEDAVLNRKREIEWLRSELGPAIETLDRGEGVPWNPAKIKAEGRKRLASRLA